MKKSTIILIGLILIVLFAIGLYLKSRGVLFAPSSGVEDDIDDYLRQRYRDSRNLIVQPIIPPPSGPCFPSQDDTVSCNIFPPDTGEKCTCDLGNDDVERCYWEPYSCSIGYTCSEKSSTGCVPKKKPDKSLTAVT